MACKTMGNLFVLFASLVLIPCKTSPDILLSTSTTQDNTISDNSISTSQGRIFSTQLAEEFPLVTTLTVPAFGLDPEGHEGDVAAGSNTESSSGIKDWSSLSGRENSSDAELPETSNTTLVTSTNAVLPAHGNSLVHSGTVSQQESDLINVVCIYVALPLAVTGVVLNALAMAVYVHPAMRSPCSCYLVSLGISQLLYLVLVSTVPITSVLLYTSTGRMSVFYNVISLHVPNFAMAALRRVSFVTTLVISFERCLAITFPLRSRKWGINRFPKVISSIIYVLVIGLHVPQLFKYEIVPYNEWDFVARMSPWWREHLEGLGALEVAVRVLLVYAPLSCTLLANVLTVLALRRHRRRSLAMQSTQDACSTRKADVQRTLAILVSTLLFVLLSLPTHLLALLNNYHPLVGYRKQEHYLYMALTHVFMLLEVLSNLSDFVAFCTLCTRFRETLVRLLRRQPGPARSREDYVTNATTDVTFADGQSKASVM